MMRNVGFREIFEGIQSASECKRTYLGESGVEIGFS